MSIRISCGHEKVPLITVKGRLPSSWMQGTVVLCFPEEQILGLLVGQSLGGLRWPRCPNESESSLQTRCCDRPHPEPDSLGCESGNSLSSSPKHLHPRGGLSTRARESIWTLGCEDCGLHICRDAAKRVLSANEGSAKWMLSVEA